MNVTDLIKEIQARWPNAWPNDDIAKIWTADYRRTLGQHQGQTLQISFERVMNTWTQQTWPKPGVFLKAIEERKTAGGGAADSDRWREYAEKVAEDLMNRKRTIRENWFEANKDLAAEAADGGWLLALRDWVKEGANIIAQRDVKRDKGETPAPLGNRWPWCADGPDGDVIVNPPAEKLDQWREAAQAYVPKGNLNASKILASDDDTQRGFLR